MTAYRTIAYIAHTAGFAQQLAERQLLVVLNGNVVLGCER